MAKYYFENEDAEICYNKEHFDDMMRETGNLSIRVFGALRENFGDVFWCSFYGESGTKGESCGKICKEYKPRNKVSGCCSHVGQLYSHGDLITLALKN